MADGFSRLVSEYAFQSDWMRKKMVFLAGPRQSGKTFAARAELKRVHSSKLYYNWDTPEVISRYRHDPMFFESDMRTLGIRRPTVVFDEIHKRARWKNELKGIYDQFIDEMNIVVTGSARLDLLRKTGESLAGRYFLFRVFPLGVQEAVGRLDRDFRWTKFEDLAEALASVSVARAKENRDTYESLIRVGGFPDPLSNGTMEYRRKWAADYQRLILREDLRDLSRIQEIDRVETLWSLLPDRVGAPLSVRSLQEDLSASHEAVRTWLLNLEKLYSIFLLQPYSKRVARAVKKERKAYLMDWASVPDESKRFENFVISSLLRSTGVWTDSGQGDFDLRYVRNVQGQEADFLILRDGKPWILGDAKLKANSIDPHLYRMAEALGGIPVIQVVAESGVLKRPSKSSLIVSADRLFSIFP